MTPLEAKQAETMAQVARWLDTLITLGEIKKRMDKWNIAVLNACAKALSPRSNPRLRKLARNGGGTCQRPLARTLSRPGRRRLLESP
jgi:hypothetical protein